MADAVTGFATALRAAGYSVRGARTEIGRRSALESLIDLFLMGVDLPIGEAEPALAPVPLENLAAAGLIECDREVVKARIRVLPYEDLLVACDRDPDLDGRLERDHVGGIHPSTALLALLTPRLPVDRALDIGCGCGFQALLLARHAGAVVATDVNPRAIEFGRLNAQLNGIDNISWRLGDGQEPIAGERFDLVVSNPPFVIAPRARFTFRESPLPGDSFSEQLVREVPEVLTANGVACLLASWAVAPGDDWSARPVAWTEGSGRGRLLLHLETVDAATNAAQWAVPPGAVSRTESAALVSEWLDYYRANAISRIAYGAVILHPTPGLTLIELAGTPGPDAPAHVARIIDGQASLAGRPSSTLLDAVLTPPVSTVNSGLGIGIDLDHDTAQLLARLDGRRALREVLGTTGGDAPDGASLDRLADLVRFGLVGIVSDAG
jgi:SAM-dependent methyltransferase